MNQRELATLMKEWKDEILEISRDYKDAVATLDLVRVDLENNKRKFWNVYRTPIITVTTTLVIVGIILIFGLVGDWCKVTIEYPVGISASKTCPLE